jgi:hypothetical protein
MAMSFIYVAFIRLLQLLRLRRSEHDEPTVQVVVLRHEAAILRRQVDRPALQPADRALVAGLSHLVSKAARRRLFVEPPHCCAGIGTRFGDDGRILGVVQVGQLSRRNGAVGAEVGEGQPKLNPECRVRSLSRRRLQLH